VLQNTTVTCSSHRFASKLVIEYCLAKHVTILFVY
jgi:hypothetical protein